MFALLVSQAFYEEIYGLSWGQNINDVLWSFLWIKSNCCNWQFESPIGFLSDKQTNSIIDSAFELMN